jgi:hypothetical protein
MKTSLTLLSLLMTPLVGWTATTINVTNHYAYGANLGWMDWRGETNNGAVIGDYVCKGNIYAANVGWINLGSGVPANGIHYEYLDASDFGVNHDGFGNLRGFAWGANIGWINFETNGAASVNLRTGALSGYVWSANCGWISLSNAVANVQTDSLWPGQLDTNGLPLAWELLQFGTTVVDANADPDHDGMSNAEEYLAGTDPNDANSVLGITAAQFSPGGLAANLTWNSVPTRFYYIQKALTLAPAEWSDSGLGLLSPAPGSSTTASFADTNAPARFYRVKVTRPLSP